MLHFGRAFAIALALAVALAAVALSAGEGRFADRIRRAVYVGGPLLEVRLPTPGQQVALGGVEVLVGFPAGERVAVHSFRCVLNNRDVTELLTLAPNGAGGAVFGLVEGENQLRLEVFGQSWWSQRYFQDIRTVVFYVRPLPNIDRA